MSSWSFRDTPLEYFGIVTQVSDGLKMPERRGGNVTLPFRQGRVYVEKFLDQRSMTLGLEIHEESIASLEERIDELKQLMGLQGLGVLEQRMENFSVRRAMAEFTGDFGLARVSPLCVKMVLEFTLPDPLFYGVTASVYEFSTTDVVSEGDEETVTNGGTTEARNVEITLTGPLENVTITNTTLNVSLMYNAAIPAGGTVNIQTDANTGEFTALDNLGNNVIGNVEHEGDWALMSLAPGDNLMFFLDELATSGLVGISFYPPYL